MAPQYQTPAAQPVRVVQPVVAARADDGPAMSFEGLLRLDKFTKLFPVYFSGTPSEDPQDYLDRCHEVLRNMGIVKTNGVNFAVFQMTGSTKRWWKDFVSTRPAGSPALTWDQFSHIFLEKFLPIILRKDCHRHLERLQQGSMSLTQFETRFADPIMLFFCFLLRERERVGRFIEGLAQPIKLHMAKETGSENSFQTAANVARRIEMVLAHGGGQGSNKRPHYSGGFSGASSGGRGTFGRGRPPRPFHSTLQASYGVQGSRAMVPAPGAPSPTQPARGRGQASRGGDQVVRSGGQLVRGCPRDVV
ncbi:uncharacterized protein [Nicotiana tomentosiformis]|uniref:uncharacterized protein n=1 Tax=Nicotiana tomentosiformis TaxID=4098 RepID=UPI00388C8B23